MKKLNLLVLSSALILGLASCGGNNNPTPSSEQTTESTSVDTTDYAALGATAITNISASFDKWANGITSNKALSAESKVTDNGKEYTFAITYTVSTEAAAHLSISEDGKTLKVTPDEGDHNYKSAVTVHASINGSEKASKSFNVKVAKKTYIDLADVYTKANGDAVTTRGYVEHLNQNAGLIYISSGVNSIAVYTSVGTYYTGNEALKAGDFVEVQGAVSIYEGLYEIASNSKKNITLKIKKVDEDDSAVAPVALTVDGKTDLTKAADIQSRKATATGYLSDISSAHEKTNSKKTRIYDQIDATIVVGSTTDGWQTISVHLESDKLYDKDAILASWDYDATEGKFGDNAPKKGDKISVEGYMSWYKTAQIGDATLKSKGAWEGDVPSNPEKDVVETTISELNKKTESESNVAYKVTGIYEVSNGKKYLTDATTGESILIYKLAGTEGTGVTWNGIDGYTFKDDKDASTSLADLKAGEEVTLKALNVYYSGTPEISANLISHKASTATYTASVTKTGDDAATVALSKDKDLAYGDEVTVTATAGTTNYVVDKVVVTDAAGTETDITETMKFNATCVNKVKVTFKDGSVVVNSTTLTADNLGISSYSSTPATKEVDGVSWSYVQVMLGTGENAGAIQTRINSGTNNDGSSKDGVAGNIYNTTALPKAIKNVVVTFKKAKNQNLVSVTSGTSAISTASTAETGSWTSSTTQTEYTYTPASTATSDVYVSISHTTKSGAVYIDSIVINFVD